MKKNEVEIGGTYQAKVSNKLVTVRIDSAATHSGWFATNLDTGKQIRIKTAQRLRQPVGETRSTQTKTTRKTKVAKRVEGSLSESLREAGDIHGISDPPEKPAKHANTSESKPMSALNAAAKVLGESSEPMTTNQMIDAMAAKGYWTSPGGKTPSQTLYAAILREITTKGDESRFTKTSKGHFAAKA